MGRGGAAVRRVPVGPAGMTADNKKTLALLGPGGRHPECIPHLLRGCLSRLVQFPPFVGHIHQAAQARG